MARFFIERIEYQPKKEVYVLRNRRKGYENCMFTLAALVALSKSKRINDKTRKFFNKAIDMINNKIEGDVVG